MFAHIIIRLNRFSYTFICITLAITGSEKRCDEGVPLFAVRVDGVVRGHVANILLKAGYTS